MELPRDLEEHALQVCAWHPEREEAIRSILPRWREDLERLTQLEKTIEHLNDQELELRQVMTPGPDLGTSGAVEQWLVLGEHRGRLVEIYVKQAYDALDNYFT